MDIRKVKRGGKDRYCQRHWPSEILNDDPHGIFIVLLIEDRLLKVREFVDYAIDNKSLNSAYNHYAPVCCFLGEAIMQDVYERAAVIHHKSNAI